VGKKQRDTRKTNRNLISKSEIMVLSDRLFGQFSELVYRECGINLHDGKKSLLQARLNKRLRITGFTSYESYFEYLTSGESREELVHFLDCISTNLTYFFREPQHFEFLNKMIPEMLAAKQKERDQRIRVWSAGCSTGEEPYSLGMGVLQHLKDPDRYDFKILATDISSRVLDVAKAGIYPSEKLQRVHPDLRKQFFKKPTGNGSSADSFEVVPLLKNIVKFARLNLNESYPFKGPFDFIFCRNVMIYFDKKTQELLIQKMSQYLVAGGYLFVGHSESLMGLNHSMKYICPAVYRK
jgi:chemotaxis protein methyltransferase CheR